MAGRCANNPGRGTGGTSSDARQSLTAATVVVPPVPPYKGDTEMSNAHRRAIKGEAD